MMRWQVERYSLLGFTRRGPLSRTWDSQRIGGRYGYSPRDLRAQSHDLAIAHGVRPLEGIER